MKRKVFIYIVTVYLILLLQSTVFSYLKIFNVKPNLLLVFVVSMALLRGNVEGAIIGFFAGLAQDMLFGKAIGFYAVLGMYTGLITGSVNKRLYRENILVGIFFTFLSTLVYESLVFIPHVAVNGFKDVYFAYERIILPEALYNCAAAIIIYILAIRIHYRFEEIDKSARKY